MNDRPPGDRANPCGVRPQELTARTLLDAGEPLDQREFVQLENSSGRAQVVGEPLDRKRTLPDRGPLPEVIERIKEHSIRQARLRPATKLEMLAAYGANQPEFG